MAGEGHCRRHMTNQQSRLLLAHTCLQVTIEISSVKCFLARAFWADGGGPGKPGGGNPGRGCVVCTTDRWVRRHYLSDSCRCASLMSLIHIWRALALVYTWCQAIGGVDVPQQHYLPLPHHEL